VSRIRIPPTLRDSTGGEREVQVEGATVRDLLEELVARFPALRGQVYDGEVASFVNVYVEGVDIRTLDGLETPVSDGSTVILLPAMAGGLPRGKAGRNSGQSSARATSRLVRSSTST
jgi:molybdopterin synthase sulfur carrier subunit